jgi:hypothetical protein
MAHGKDCLGQDYLAQVEKLATVQFLKFITLEPITSGVLP